MSAGAQTHSAHIHADIAQLMARFAHGIDRCDWALYRSVFADEIDLDYSTWRATDVGRWQADDWVARARRLFPGLSATRHALTNLFMSGDDDLVQVRVNVCAEHVLDGPGGPAIFTVNGYYDDRCVATGGGWKISAKRLVVEWCTGDRGLLTTASERVAAGSPDLRGWEP
jgi:3-phenylpropionate/cinnamic acid dioxygenase small subunit